MVVVQGDISWRLSGGASNLNPYASLGGAMSSKEITEDVLNNLWDNVSKSEQQNGDTEYRCIYVRNGAASDPYTGAKVWFFVSQQYISMGLGTAAIGAAEQTIPNENTAPSGVNFTQPNSEGVAQQIGSIGSGQYKAIWIRRVIPPNATQESLLYRIKIKGGTS